VGRHSPAPSCLLRGPSRHIRCRAAARPSGRPGSPSLLRTWLTASRRSALRRSVTNRAKSSGSPACDCSRRRSRRRRIGPRTDLGADFEGRDLNVRFDLAGRG
jgi:hypothetical protein